MGDVTHEDHQHPVAEHSATLARLTERFTQQEREMDAFQARLQQSVSEYHEQRVEFAELKSAVGAITQTLGRMEATLGKIEAHAAATNGRIGRLETAAAVTKMQLALAGAAIVPLYAAAVKQLLGW